MGLTNSTEVLRCESGEDVGKLPELHSELEEPYVVFLSHTGRDQAKEELARPTYYFLNEILGIKTFIDDGEMEWGSNTDEGLAGPAYQCTHAVVILSPSFRQRPYCVKELNTFLHRYQQAKQAQDNDGGQQNTFKLLPALWKLHNLRDYPRVLHRICWASHDTDTAIYYMLQTLWPRLIKSLGLPPKSERELRVHLFTYMHHQFGRLQLPGDFHVYAKDHGCWLAVPPQETMESSNDSSRHNEAGSSTERVSKKVKREIVGVCFENVDMDGDKRWNEKVLEKKQSIEENLAIIAKYGNLIYGRPTMSQEHKDSLGLAVVRLGCRYQLKGDLSEDDYAVARDAAIAIGKLLKAAGTKEEDLNEIMVGTFWKGSLVLLLEAPEPLLEMLHQAVVIQGKNLLNAGDENEFKVTGMTPAFTIHAQTTDGSDPSFLAISSLGKHSDVVLWRDETAVADLNLLLPTALEAQGKLLACGVPYQEWFNDNFNGWNSMPTTLSPEQNQNLDEAKKKEAKEHATARQHSSAQKTRDLLETLCESGLAVGSLQEPQLRTEDVSNDNQEEPFVFLSYTGRDDAKEELARPTHFFLKKILGIKTFFDVGDVPWGTTAEEGLAKAAYECTLALVILSPSFRQSRYCVKELNTFLHRFRQAQTAPEQHMFKLLPALWKMDNLNGYPDDLKQISWSARDAENAVYYMLQTLWPRLIEALGLPQMSESELQGHFFTYLNNQLGDPHLAPKDFFKYARDHGCRLFVPAVVGVSLFNIDMDDNMSWNEKVLQRKASIEENLAIIARHGKVINGRTTMSQKRKGLFGLGTPVVRLECQIQLRGDLSEDDYAVARDASIAIGKLLKAAGTTEEDLNEIMVGTFWKGG